MSMYSFENKCGLPKPACAPNTVLQGTLMEVVCIKTVGALWKRIRPQQHETNHLEGATASRRLLWIDADVPRKLALRYEQVRPGRRGISPGARAGWHLDFCSTKTSGAKLKTCCWSMTREREKFAKTMKATEQCS